MIVQTTRRIRYLWLLVLTALFVALTCVNIANYRPVSADEVWNISASHKLATEGIFGSDLYRGFFHAERHYAINLPLLHLLQALVFRAAGSGVVQARAISVAAAVVVLWCTTILAWRWYGTGVGMLAGILLLVWRSGLLATGNAPLLEVARSSRYDVVTLAFMGLCLVAFDRLLTSPTRGLALLTGFLAALAALTHFFGLFIAPVVLLGWLWQKGAGAWRDEKIFWMALGFLAPLLLYAAYLGFSWEETAGQARYLYQGRSLAPWQNLLREPRRILHMVRQADAGGGNEFLALGFVPLLLGLLAGLRQPGRGDRLLLLSLLLPWAGVALADSTKAPLYALPLLPPLCILFAAGAFSLWRHARRVRAPWLLALALLVSLAFGRVIVEGARYYRVDQQRARSVTPFDTLGAAIAAAAPEGSHIAGAERWWWHLRSHEYLAARVLWLQWQVLRDEEERSPRFERVAREQGVEYLLLNDNVWGDLRSQPPLLQEQFREFVDSCTRPLSSWHDATYGLISLQRIEAQCP